MGPTAFRDGIFSSSDPMSKYGMLLTTYSDGSLGADNKLARPVVKSEETKTYEDYAYDEGPNYALWGLVAAGVLGVGAVVYFLKK